MYVLNNYSNNTYTSKIITCLNNKIEIKVNFIFQHEKPTKVKIFLLKLFII